MNISHNAPGIIFNQAEILYSCIGFLSLVFKNLDNYKLRKFILKILIPDNCSS
jgi:hypothetical protein